MSAELDPDAALMLKVKKGDTAAFAQLVDKYKQPVMNLVIRMIRDATEAEDLWTPTRTKNNANRQKARGLRPSRRHDSIHRHQDLWSLCGHHLPDQRR